MKTKRLFNGFVTTIFTIAFLSVVPPVFAFKVEFHEAITLEELALAAFDEDSAEEVANSNIWTDAFEASSSAAHADNNDLGGASARLRSKQEQIISDLQSCKRRSALDRFGEALHTVQDIYSHSNSVDNGHSVDLLNLVDGTAFCDSTNNFAPGGLVSGYFSLGGFFNPFSTQCKDMPAGMCCHLDLNKDEPGALNGANHAAALSQARFGTLTYLKSIEDEIQARFPADTAFQMIKMLQRKQRTLAFVIDDTGSMSGDIAGVKQAANAFLDAVIASLEAPTLSLYTFKDTSSFKGDFCTDIEAFRTQLNAISASGGGDCPEASNSTMIAALQKFPSTSTDVQLGGGRLVLATDASPRNPNLGPVVRSLALQKGVKIDAILTGDCTAETAASATLSTFGTLSAPTKGSSFDIPSDNTQPSSGESTLVATTSAAATTSVPAVTPLAVAVNDPLTSPSARTQFRALAEQTGGTFFQVSRAEVESVVPTLVELSDPQTATLLTRRLTLVSGAPVTFDIPVDDTLASSVTFMVSLTRAGTLPGFTLLRPDGKPVADTDPGVTRLKLSSVESVRIDTPSVGTWQVQLDGPAAVAFRAFGQSPIRISRLRLMDPDARITRPEIEFMQLEGQPVAGKRVVADIRMTDSPKGVNVELLRNDGSQIQSQTPVVLPNKLFRIDTIIPAEPFLLAVTGQTSTGITFIRQIEVPVVPQTVGISARPKLQIAKAGTEAVTDITVTNVSVKPATFRVTANSTQGWAVTLPADFTLQPDTSGTFPIVSLIPASTPDGVQDSLTILVTDINNPTTQNGTSVIVEAGPVNDPPVCTAVQPSLATLSDEDEGFVDVEILGVTDPDNDPITISIGKITQDEPVVDDESEGTSPDAMGIGNSIAQLRAERLEESFEPDDDSSLPEIPADGRVYAVQFTATDTAENTCSGTVFVEVPLEEDEPAIDSGQLFDSTIEYPAEDHPDKH